MSASTAAPTQPTICAAISGSTSSTRTVLSRGQSARELKTPFGTLHVVSAEALIAFKLQGWVNNPRRSQDLEDIRALFRANRDSLDLDETRTFLRMFDREGMFEEMLNEHN
ncbi:MAG: hypothetical protein JSR66_24970 [Proteobacteria bacterium]|nr:hypothetical protein [Pseudomonadota bacterium]